MTAKASSLPKGSHGRSTRKVLDFAAPLQEIAPLVHFDCPPFVDREFPLLAGFVDTPVTLCRFIDGQVDLRGRWQVGEGKWPEIGQNDKGGF